MFGNEKSVSMVAPAPKVNKDTVEFETEKALLNNPEDMFKLLRWQNEQLMKLTEQVNQLIACQRKSEQDSNESIHLSSTQRYEIDLL